LEAGLHLNLLGELKLKGRGGERKGGEGKEERAGKGEGILVASCNNFYLDP